MKLVFQFFYRQHLFSATSRPVCVLRFLFLDESLPRNEIRFIFTLFWILQLLSCQEQFDWLRLLNILQIPFKYIKDIWYPNIFPASVWLVEEVPNMIWKEKVVGQTERNFWHALITKPFLFFNFFCVSHKIISLFRNFSEQNIFSKPFFII